MPKGMSLEEFKNALSSDATEKVLEQERRIKELQSKNEDLLEQLKWYEEELQMVRNEKRKLLNRCRAILPKGGACLFCEFQRVCLLGTDD